MLALLCLAVVHRLRPQWLNIDLSEAAQSEGISPQRLSRLCTRTIPGFEQTLATLTRIGRPPRDVQAEQMATELSLTRALLELATTILARVSLRKRAVQALVVGASERLLAAHPSLTLERFAQALALSPRTLRSWRASARERSEGGSDPAHDGSAEPLSPRPEPAPKRPRRPRRRPRFGFDVTLPGTQEAADTTDLRCLGVPLKLVAAQDIGGRDQNLLDAVIVDQRECAEHVVRVLTEALSGRSGMQAITDQGTPYLAEHTRQALDALEAEHAIQREADPLGKATLERAFRTVKGLTRPLLALTDRLAQAIPALANAELAKSITLLLLTSLLRAYQAGARAARRACEARSDITVEQLERAAERSRERARAHERSVRQLLEHLHKVYDIHGPCADFVRSFRRYPLAVLHQAERDFSTQVHRDDIRNRAAYFAAVVRRCNEHYQRQRARRRLERKLDERLDQHARTHEQRLARWRAEPAAWLRDALDAIAHSWIPATGRLLCNGVGAGTGWLRAALSRLVELHGLPATADIAMGVLHAFESDWIQKLGQRGVDAVAAVLHRHLEQIPKHATTHNCPPRFGPAILRNTGHSPRPDPPFPLRT